MKLLSRLRRDTRGAVMAEYALIITIMLILIGVGFDFFRMFWEWNAAAKAVERGARIAAVSDPGVAAVRNWSTTGAGQPGDTFPTWNPNNTASCTGTACGTLMTDMLYGRGNNACNPATTGPYQIGMCHIYPRINPNNVVVTYRTGGMGYYGRPGGPVVTITVSLQNMNFDFLFLRGFFPILQPYVGAAGNSFFPAATTTITSEDLSRVAP